jgi:hypothetical protein
LQKTLFRKKLAKRGAGLEKERREGACLEEERREGACLEEEWREGADSLSSQYLKNLT